MSINLIAAYIANSRLYMTWKQGTQTGTCSIAPCSFANALLDSTLPHAAVQELCHQLLLSCRIADEFRVEKRPLDLSQALALIAQLPPLDQRTPRQSQSDSSLTLRYRHPSYAHQSIRLEFALDQPHAAAWQLNIPGGLPRVLQSSPQMAEKLQATAFMDSYPSSGARLAHQPAYTPLQRPYCRAYPSCWSSASILFEVGASAWGFGQIHLEQDPTGQFWINNEGMSFEIVRAFLFALIESAYSPQTHCHQTTTSPKTWSQVKDLLNPVLVDCFGPPEIRRSPSTVTHVWHRECFTSPSAFPQFTTLNIRMTPDSTFAAIAKPHELAKAIETLQLPCPPSDFLDAVVVEHTIQPHSS